YSGGTSGPYYAYSTTYDREGNLYASALASGTGWPTNTSSFMQTYPGTCVSINKYSSNGSLLLYSTYFGGNAITTADALRATDSLELVLVGSTNASNLPVTANAYDPTYNGGYDI